MARLITLKKSAVANKVPLVNDLQYGELALNYIDGKLFFIKKVNGVDVITSFSDTTQVVLKSDMGTANGLATLDASGLVPLNQLPSLGSPDFTPTASYGINLTTSKINIFARLPAGNQLITSVMAINISDNTNATFSITRGIVPICNTINLPIGSAVELLSSPRIGDNTTNIWQALSSVSGTIQLVISYKSATGTVFSDAYSYLTTNTETTVITGISTPRIMTSVNLVATGTNAGKISVYLANNTTSVIEQYLCKNMVVPSSTTLELIQSPRIINPNQKLVVKSDTPNRMAISCLYKPA